MIAKDIPALSAVLDDSFALVHMTGMRQPKAAFLKAVANGTLNYSSAEHDSMDVTVQGNTAMLIGKSRVHAVVFGGGWHPLRIIHASTGTMCVTTDTSLGKWKYWGWLKDVIKEGSHPDELAEGDEEPMAEAEFATVIADSGSTVNMRTKAKSSAPLVECAPRCSGGDARNLRILDKGEIRFPDRLYDDEVPDR